MEIRSARIPEEVPAVRDLFREYAARLGIDLCFQQFDDELAKLPGSYVAPAGQLLVADAGSELAGCVACRPHLNGACEMKRLYVRAQFRGHGLGRRLVEQLLERARSSGYREVVLDALPVMSEAIALYRSAGFLETAAYCVNPVPGALYFRRFLG